jgi:hypothetical protein
MEAEIIPMCEDQGMAIVPWAALGGGQLMSAEQRKQKEQDPGARKGRYSLSENDLKVCEVLEQIAETKSTTLQATVCPMMGLGALFSVANWWCKQALAYLFHQSTYVFPIVGVQTVEHVKAMPDALRIKLSKEEIDSIHNVAIFNPLFPMNFLFNFRGDQKYNLTFTAAHNQQYQMAAWIDAPPKQPVSELCWSLYELEPSWQLGSLTNLIVEIEPDLPSLYIDNN